MKTKETSKKKNTSVFAQNLKKILEERKISQADAARLAGIKRSTINDWLAGTNPQDLQAVQKLSTAINCDFQWLVTGTISPKQQPEDLSLNQLFDIETDASFSGIYIIEAKKLKRRSTIQKGDK